MVLGGLTSPANFSSAEDTEPEEPAPKKLKTTCPVPSSASIEYDAITNSLESPLPQEPKAACPEGCEVEPWRPPEIHWHLRHERTTLLFTCPFPPCMRQFAADKGRMWAHVRTEHHVAEFRIDRLRELPYITCWVNSNKYVAPKNPSPYGKCREPAGSIRRDQKNLDHNLMRYHEACDTLPKPKIPPTAETTGRQRQSATSSSRPVRERLGQHHLTTPTTGTTGPTRPKATPSGRPVMERLGQRQQPYQNPAVPATVAASSTRSAYPVPEDGRSVVAAAGKPVSQQVAGGIYRPVRTAGQRVTAPVSLPGQYASRAELRTHMARCDALITQTMADRAESGRRLETSRDGSLREAQRALRETQRELQETQGREQELGERLQQYEDI